MASLDTHSVVLGKNSRWLKRQLNVWTPWRGLASRVPSHPQSHFLRPTTLEIQWPGNWTQFPMASLHFLFTIRFWGRRPRSSYLAAARATLTFDLPTALKFRRTAPQCFDCTRPPSHENVSWMLFSLTAPAMTNTSDGNEPLLAPSPDRYQESNNVETRNVPL